MSLISKRVNVFLSCLLALVMLIPNAITPLPVMAADIPIWPDGAAIMFTNTTLSSSFTINWTPATGATSYNVLVSESYGGSTTTVLNTSVSSNTTTLNGLPPSGWPANACYYVTITAVNSSGNSITNLTGWAVVPSSATFTFLPGLITDSGRYKFQPAATKDTVKSNFNQTVYNFNSQVEPSSTVFEWYVQGGYNTNTDVTPNVTGWSVLRGNLKCFHLFNLTDGIEIPLDYGNDADRGSLSTNAGSWSSNPQTVLTTGDFTLIKSYTSSVYMTFRLNIAGKLQSSKSYEIAIDPHFNTGGKSPTYLSSVYRFDFNTIDTQPPAWGGGAQINVGTIGSNSVSLSWPTATDNVGVTKYKVVAGTSGAADITSYVTTNSSAVTGLTPATQYNFTITALDAASNESSPLMAQVTTLALVPVWGDGAQISIISANSSSVSLYWPAATAGSVVNQYKVVTSNNGNVVSTNFTATTTYAITGLTPDTPYNFAITALDALNNESSALTTVARTLAPIPVWPNNAVLTVSNLMATSLSLNWPQVTTSGLEGYIVSVNGTEEANLPSPAYYYDLYGVSSSQKLNLSVTPYNRDGNSGLPLETMVVTPGGGGLGFTFAPATVDEGTDSTGFYHRYTLVNPVDLNHFNLNWYFDHGLDKNLRFNLEHMHLINKNSGEEIALDRGTEPYESTPEGVFVAGDFSYISTGGGSGSGSSDPNKVRLLKFEPGTNTRAKFNKGAEYIFELDPEFIANNGVASLGKIFVFDFTIAVDDTESPTWPTGAQITASHVGPESMILSWPQATDNIGIAEYQLYWQGQSLDLIRTFANDVNSSLMTGLTPGTSYNLVLRARDAAYNYTADLTLAVTTLLNDDQSPTWPVGSSLTVDNILTDNLDLSWSAATDNVGVTGYRVMKNGSTLSDLDANTLLYHVSQLTPNTSYIFKIEARDQAGNYSTTGPQKSVSTLAGQADTTPPTWTSSGSMYTSTVYNYGQTIITFGWPWATDNVAVTGYVVSKNGTPIATVNAYTNSYTDTLVPDLKDYTYSVVAIDAAGNRSTSRSAGAVNSGDPNPDIYSPIWPSGTNITLSDFTDSNATNDATVRATWTPAQDDRSSVYYTFIVDGGWWDSTNNCQYILNHLYPGYPHLLTGDTHVISLKAWDAVENGTHGDPQITVVLGTNPTAGSGIPFTLANVANTRGSLNSLTGALNQVMAAQDPENLKLTWTFDEALASGYTGKITLVNATTKEAIALAPANIVYAANSGKYNLTLDLTQTGIKLADNTNYVVKLAKTLTAQSGHTLGFDIAWQFSTAVADKVVPRWTASDALDVVFVNAPTIATLNWPAASDNIAVTQYRVYQGETLLATLTGNVLSYNVEGLMVNTAYNFKVLAGDYLNNLSTPLAQPAITPRVDSIAPAWQNGDSLTFSGIGSDYVTVFWPAATDNYQVRKYQVSINGSSQPFIETASNVLQSLITGLSGETTYSITIKAIDYSGNIGSLSGNVTTTADFVSPVWPSGSKLQAQNIKDTSVTLFWDAATDNVGVTGYNVYCNGQKVQSVNGSTVTANVTGLNGATQYAFAVEASDLKGNLTATRLSLQQWTAPNSITTGAAYAFTLIKPASHNLNYVSVNNTLNNALDGSFTRNNVAFTFNFDKTLAENTWYDNIEIKDGTNKPLALENSFFTYTVLSGGARLKIVVPTELVSNGSYLLTVKQNLQASDNTLLGRNFTWSFNVSGGLYGVTDIAAGYYSYNPFLPPSSRFYLMLKDDGSVWTWGNNDYGTLGDGTTDRRDIPVKVDGLSGIVAVEAGRDSSYALDQNGNVWAWGSNEFGQLGRGYAPSGTSGRYGNNTPQKISGLSAVVKLSYGFGNVAAIDENGLVWNWGFASQSGYSSDTQCSGTPLLINGLTNVIDVAAGYGASLAVTASGDVYTFSKGQIPVKVSGLSEIVAVDARGTSWQEANWMALKSDGTAYIWDNDDAGTVTRTPVRIANASQIKAIIADGPYLLNTSGQASTIDCTSSPSLGTNISGLNNLVKLSSSAQGGLALRVDGSLLQFIGSTVTEVPFNMNPVNPPLWPQGSALTITNLAETGLTLNWAKPDPAVSGFAIYQNGGRITSVSGDALSYDVLGLTKGQTYTFKIEARFANSDWTTSGPQITQTMNGWTPTIQNAGKLAMSGSHTLLVGDDGSVWAWGSNDYGQLGLGNTIDQLTPIKINTLTNITAVAAGDNHSLALDKDGNVWTWGRNNVYQLGNNTTANSNIPVKIISTGNITAISAAGDHSLALKNNGTVLGWGEDSYATYYSLSGIDGHTPGQLNHGTVYAGQNYPITGVKSIATSREFSAYLMDDGRIFRLGHFVDNVGSESLMPIPYYSTPLGITYIAAGDNFVTALRQDGTVLTFGDGNFGQYGDGSQGNGTPANPKPYGVAAGLHSIVQVAAGGYHILALDSKGDVYTWGKNLNGQLGNGQTNIGLIPIKVSSLTGITTIGGGTETSITFKNMTRVYAWGNNDDGQLGDGNQFLTKVPALVKMPGSNIDSDPPVWPTSFILTASNISANSVSLSWTPAIDDIQVSNYEIFVNGQLSLETGSDTPAYSLANLTPGAAYLVGIKAKDSSNNLSVLSNTITVNTLAPVVSLYSNMALTAPCSSFASSNNHVYVKGTNFAAGAYNVYYYDNTGNVKGSNNNVAVGSDGILLSDYSLRSDKTASPGGWHVLVQPSSGTMSFGTNTYATITTSSVTYGVLASGSFTASSSAIPEFPTAATALGVVILSLGIFCWMRRTRVNN